MKTNRSIIWSHKPFEGWKKIYPILDSIIGLVVLQIFGMLGLYTISKFIVTLPGLGIIMSMLISFLFFYLKYNLLKRNWLLLNIEYSLSKEGITFSWGTFDKHSFFLPFEHMVKVSYVGFEKSEYSKIYFHTLHDVFDFDFDHLTDDEIRLICMEHIPKGKKVFELIEYLRTGEVNGTKLERILLKREMSKLDNMSLDPSY